MGMEAWRIWDNKVKPQLSLGRLEYLAVEIVEMLGSLHPAITRPKLLLFAADHGIVAEGVSSSPQEITWQQCVNFAQGGGAIGLICNANNIDLEVIDVGVAHKFEPGIPIVDRKIAWGTQNFLSHAAMSGEQLYKVLKVGVDLVEDSVARGYRIFAFGEMGIGNTTSASALMAALTSFEVTQCCGRGAGLDDRGVAHKCKVIGDALQFHGKLTDPLEILRTYGGFEIAAITGGMLGAASRRAVILVDGFIASMAAAFAIAIEPLAQQYMVFCHESGEGGHPLLLKYLGVEPLLSLKMRLGEGTGAAVAWPIIRQSLDLYLNMNSFSSAKVTDSVAMLKQQGVDLHEYE